MYHFHFLKVVLLTKLMSAPSVIMLPYFRTLDRHSQMTDLFSGDSINEFRGTHSLDRRLDRKNNLRKRNTRKTL